MTSISIAGVGRMGSALALSLHQVGFEIDLLVSRDDNAFSRQFPEIGSSVLVDNLAEIASNILFITTPDQFIKSTAEIIKPKLSEHTIVMHCSGSLSSDELHSLCDNRNAVGSMHPLLSVTGAVGGSQKFSGAYFCVEGDDRAVSAAEELVNALGGIKISIPTDKKPLYHAAAVMSSGHLTALLDVAVDLMTKCGIDSENSVKMLMPLVKSTVANIEAKGTTDALTGPFARNDIDAFRRHISALEYNTDDEQRAIYLDLASHSLKMVESSRPKDESSENLARAVNVEKNKLN